MRFHVDLHLHSHLSRATSKNLNLEHLSKWAQCKGIRVVGTGDFVHPAWMDELEKKLEPAEEGLFRLKPEYERLTRDEVPAACRAPVRFMLTVEISNIYKRLDRVRKIHNIVFAPGFDAGKRLQARLEAIGNIRADGRPILGLDSRDLLEITLESDPLAFLIPAHIWTPWFAVLGSQGGFDRIEDCFADLTPHLFAIETGLSSDPLMNWRLSQLDPYVIVSNSDAHSPHKLGRETTVFDTECAYPAIYRALSDPDDPGLAGTVEFFPEEGKYHYDGHRKCEARLHPRETIAHGGLCPVCGKPVTVGVMARVEALADRPEGVRPPRWRPYHRLIPLPEVIGEAKRMGPDAKGVEEVFMTMLARLGNEFHILMEAPVEDIRVVAGPLIAEGIRRVRAGEVSIAPGYDGAYGTIRLFEPGERETIGAQASLFDAPPDASARKTATPSEPPRTAGAPATPETPSPEQPAILSPPAPEAPPSSPAGLGVAEPAAPPAFPPEAARHGPLNTAQQQAVTYTGGHLLIVAGPGTGKTHTLTHRVAYLSQGMVSPRHILAVTFTNKAAGEMKERLARLLDDAASPITVGTFHSVCLSLLRAWARQAHIPATFTLATPDDMDRLARALWPDDTAAQRRERLENISRWKATGLSDEMPETVAAYTRFLRKHGLLDFDDVLLETLKLLRASARFREDLQARFRYVFVDEYQDINPAQHALLLELVQNGVQITAIGDPHQAIYGFRGAESKYFHTFSADFPDARTLYLSENYRSAPALLDASSQVIGAAGAMQAPALVATLYLQGRLVIHEASTDSAEAEYVVHQIERLVGGTSMFSRDSGRVDERPETERSFGDIAVLYRLNSQRMPLMEALERSGIPYQTAGDSPLIDRPGVLEMTTLLRLGYGMSVTAAAALRLLSTAVEGLGEKTARQIDALWEQRTQVSPSHLRALLDHPGVLPYRSRSGVRAVLADIEHLSEHPEQDIAAALAGMTDAACWPMLAARYASAEDHLKRLIRCARLETDVTAYLDHLMLSREYDAYGDEAERVMLMTLHAAKGLEFPAVFIVGCEHDLLPLQYPGMTADPDEERRLFYVGMTRAKEQLYLLHARRRTLFGHTHQTAPSPFLSDIQEQLKQYDRSARRLRSQKQIPPSSQLNLFGE
jgi:uncharacterized protein (TIGR00375 family)